MLDDRALRKLLPTLPTRPLRDSGFRAMRLRWANDPLGRSRPIHAQRYDLAGGARVLYLALDAATCHAEIQAFAVPAFAAATIPIEVELNAVLDLRDPKVLKQLQLMPRERDRNFRVMRTPSPTQLLGELCAATCAVDGLIYPSLARSGGSCLAVIESALAPLGSRIRVADPTAPQDALP